VNERRAIRLDAVRADGWFERLGDDSPNFRQLCDAVGEKFVAFSVIAGVRITALTVDRRSPDATLVDFVVGDDTTEQRLALGEFRRRLVSAILAEEAPSPVDEIEQEDESDLEAIQEVIGFRYVLLAPMFGIKLLELRRGGDEPAELLVESMGSEEEMTVGQLREVIRERVRRELERSRPSSPFAIDLAAIPAAEEAMADGDHAKAIELLGAWPGPLSLLLRTTEGAQLSPEVKATLARALGLLGSAYVRAERFDWAEEVMRLGIQWGQDGPAAGDLFRRMGESCVVRDRHGEAIGLLRRALALGASSHEVLPLLAAAYAERNRWVAAALCAEEALALGADAEQMGALRDDAVDKLGPAWHRFRERVPAPSTATQTMPAPPPPEGED
jgi:tetratricopeptide (TPR) repeat protein